MVSSKGVTVLVLVVWFGFACSKEKNALVLPPIIADHMVLQQNQRVTLWGWANPGSRVTVQASWQEMAQTVTRPDSTWSVRLSTPAAGGPFTLNIANSDTLVTIREVMSGEVWLASGQSNMEMPLMGWPPTDTLLHADQEIASADFPAIRQFTVTKNISSLPLTSFAGRWDVCSPQTAGNFSATAYFFARSIHQTLGVPVGIIHSSWGGTPAESWTSGDTLRTFPEFQPVIVQLDSLAGLVRQQQDWLRVRPVVRVNYQDINPWDSLSFHDESMSHPDADDGQWESVELPQTFERSAIGGFDGVVWYRKTINIPASWDGQPAILELGPIDDMDRTYVNGKLAGSYEADGFWQTPRTYQLPAGWLRGGENVVAVRVMDIRGNGGFAGQKQDLKLYLSSDPRTVLSLAGPWKYQPAAMLYQSHFTRFDLPTREYYQMPKLPVDLGPYTASTLYNAMIHPLIPYQIQGAIWYQGESNFGNPPLYRRLFPTMINTWRTAWGQGDFPFYYVQIAPFNYGDWSKAAGLREAQLKSLRVPLTGMAVTLDVGNPQNIHPANKRAVGERLALWALAKTYAYDTIFSGPLYQTSEIQGAEIQIRFDYADGGLKAGPQGVKNIFIAGLDRTFKPAIVRIDGEKLIVSSKQVKQPVAVRYCWDNASEASLFNSFGLPASSFRTDDWEN